jgi:hypothetical protein
MKPLVKDGPHEIKQEERDGKQFVMFDPRVMSAFRLGSKIIWWRMQERGTLWTDSRLGDGLRFDLVRPRGNLACWCFLRLADMRYYFMGEVPEGQGDMERLHGKPHRGRKAY